MTNVMKKISALLLSFALIMTMMPLLAAEVNAEGTKAFGVKVNGVDVGEVTRERLEDTNDSLTNVYPYPASQGGTWTYVVAKGVPYASIVKESLGVDDLSALSGSYISWLNESGAPAGKGGDFPTDLLESSTTIFKLVDENGDDITGPFKNNPPNDAKAVAIEGAESTVPVISTVSSDTQKSPFTYEQAVAAKDGFGPETEGTVTTITTFVGGYLAHEEETYLKKDGKVNPGAFNFLGKHAIKVTDSRYSMNLKLAAPEVRSMTFDYPEDTPQDLDLGYDLPEETLAKLIAGATWESADENVAKVEEGKVVPVGIGSTTITATFPEANPGVVGTINVKVHGNKAFNVSVNGIEVERVDRERLLEGNDIFTNIYPFPSGQGKNWNYAVAKGVPYANIIKDSLGLSDFTAISGAIIGWLDEVGSPVGKGNGDFPVDKLESANTVFKLVDENGYDITGPFNGENPKDAKAVAIDGAGATTPIISTVSKKGLTYDEAVAAKEIFGPETEGVEIKLMPYVGGDLSDESQNYLKKDGTVNAKAFNFLGKYAIDVQNSGYSMNLRLAAPETLEMTFDGPDADKQDLVLGYDLSGEILNKLIEGAEWTSSNPKVAKVENGQVVPVATGTATITAKFPAATESEFNAINVVVKGSIQDAKVALSKTSFTYNAKVQKPTIKTIGGKTLKLNTDYTAKWSNASSKVVGTYTITITGKGAYEGTTKATYKIVKAANPLKLKVLTGTVKYKKVRKKAQTLKVSKVIKVTKKGVGKLTYAKSSGNKKITINKKTGKVTVKKGLKKGTYKVKVKVKAAGNANYKPITRTVTFKVRVK